MIFIKSEDQEKFNFALGFLKSQVGNISKFIIDSTLFRLRKDPCWKDMFESYKKTREERNEHN